MVQCEERALNNLTVLKAHKKSLCLVTMIRVFDSSFQEESRGFYFYFLWLCCPVKACACNHCIVVHRQHGTPEKTPLEQDCKNVFAFLEVPPASSKTKCHFLPWPFTSKPSWQQYFSATHFTHFRVWRRHECACLLIMWCWCGQKNIVIWKWFGQTSRHTWFISGDLKYQGWPEITII